VSEGFGVGPSARTTGRSGEIERDIYRRRFADPERAAKDKVWAVLCRHWFQRYVPADATVLDYGAGYCEFINHIHAARRIAMDMNPDTGGLVSQGVEFVRTEGFEMEPLPDGSVTVVFMSNLLEHIPDKERVLCLLRAAHRKLAVRGRILILGPNIRYAYREYWDFFDHLVPLSHVSLKEALALAGFTVEHCWPRFLPYTTKGRLPMHPLFVRLYLTFPPAFRIFGKQFFIVAQKSL
jgi:hypothetical protein